MFIELTTVDDEAAVLVNPKAIRTLTSITNEVEDQRFTEVAFIGGGALRVAQTTEAIVALIKQFDAR